MSPSIASLSATLAEARRARGLTQQALGDAAGISRRTLVNALAGTEDYKLSTLLALADRLGLEVALLPKGTAAVLSPGTPAPAVRSRVDAARERLRTLPAPGRAAPPSFDPSEPSGPPAPSGPGLREGPP